ncbi:MAG: hypothetical protein ACXV5Q_08365 [Frankiaceae bacterium]
MANCERALSFAVPYLKGAPYPKDVLLPDYNLDSDRGYAWPCWDVDWKYPENLTVAVTMKPFPWNGCDPYPMDTLDRVSKPPGLGIVWGSGTPRTLPSGDVITPTDPWGSPRSGNAWVNAARLGAHGDCQFAQLPFPSIVINPKTDTPRGVELSSLDGCRAAPNADPRDPDYFFATNPLFLHSDLAPRPARRGRGERVPAPAV